MPLPPKGLYDFIASPHSVSHMILIVFVSFFLPVKKEGIYIIFLLLEKFYAFYFLSVYLSGMGSCMLW